MSLISNSQHLFDVLFQRLLTSIRSCRLQRRCLPNPQPLSGLMYSFLNCRNCRWRVALIRFTTMAPEWMPYPRASFRSRSAPQRWIPSLSHAWSLQPVMRFSSTASCSTPSCIHRPRFGRNLVCTRSIPKKTFKKPPFFGPAFGSSFELISFRAIAFFRRHASNTLSPDLVFYSH